jgi:ferric-dicitrate binding protein FerR (iron transport regulator)
MTDINGPGAERREENEDAMAEMLRLAGLRPEVTPERTARVRAAVHAAWQADRRRAIRTKILVGATCVAAAALLVLAIRSKPTGGPVTTPILEAVARSERVIGTPRLERHSDREPLGLAVTVGMAIGRGDIVETDASSAAALNTDDGTSVRLDAGTRVRLLSAKSIDLVRGRVYIATAKAATGFEVRTRFGTVHDRGTRFEVRLEEQALHLRIRDGLVELKDRHQTVVAQAGQETIVTSTRVETKPLPTYGAEWTWTDRLRPPFDIEGRTLAMFLEHLAGEEGWSLRYADDELERAASAVILHGSVEGLSAEEALGVAISTSGLRHRLREGKLLVFRSSARQ